MDPLVIQTGQALTNWQGFNARREKTPLRLAVCFGTFVGMKEISKLIFRQV